MSRKISDSTVRRLSLYLRFLEEFERGGTRTVSSRELARRGATTAAQVRKDLSLFGSFGKRGRGYDVADLSDHLRDILGLGRRWRVALVGAGRIGTALFEYADFRRRGFEIVTVFDSDPGKVGRCLGEVRIEAEEDLERVLAERPVDIAVLAVPVEAAQGIVDRLAAVGVHGVLNFAPTQLHAPAGVALRDVNMSMELEALAFSLSQGPDA
ncbi:MAG: redox-sensing transcriptional repressor Rex [Gemmatimonadota bacterium]